MLALGRCVRTVNYTRPVYRCGMLALGRCVSTVKIIDVSTDVEC